MTLRAKRGSRIIVSNENVNVVMIKVNDVVEILPNSVFGSLVGKRGVVRQKIGKNTSIVQLPANEKHHDMQSKETFSSASWYFQDKHLKVLDSPNDSRIGDLEEQVQSLEDDLLIARACLSTSEELRDRQFDLLENMKEEIDNLRAEVYHLQNRRIGE